MDRVSAKVGSEQREEQRELTFDGGGVLGQRSKSRGSFVFDRVGSRVEQLKDALDVPRLKRKQGDKRPKGAVFPKG